MTTNNEKQELKEEKRKKAAPALIRVLQGMLIGVGGILPGISGGVMCAIFGLYQPVMEFLAHPIKNFKTHIKLLLPAGIGLVIGFLGLAKLVLMLFQSNEIIATCVFVGLILGMLPSLWKEAGEKGRKASSFVTMCVAFAVIFGIFLVLEFAAKMNITPNVGWFFASGIFFGLGIVVPGMSASSPLLYLGLMEPLLNVASSFMDNAVLFIKGSLGFGEAISAMRFDAAIPFMLGVAVIFIGLSRIVNYLIGKFYSQFYHGIFGVVAATTLPILIFKLDAGNDLAIKILCLVIGFIAAWLLDKLSSKYAK
ncbi:MAG: DUF368 domain-containing protein [Clostridia bacterium]|nr:DUF368 domain-containing protein [Clostridia bacterium]